MKNELVAKNQQPMMSSQEIAELTNKSHTNVIRDIWVMLEQLYNITKDASNLSHKKNQEVTLIEGVITVIDSRGYVSEIKLDRRHTEILISGYDIVRRAAIIDRWHALETGAALPDQSSISRKQLALMVIEAEDRAEAFSIENKQLNATVESLEKRFRKGMTITSFCKSLNGVNVSKVMSWAGERNWVFNSRRDQSKSPKWRVASYARDKYLTEEETQITPHGMDEFTKFTPVLLEKGCQRLFQLYMKGELPMKKTWNGEYSHDKAIYTMEGK
ncbi:Rha family transcriptional regulator [Morganella morganii subsp. sibonii]